MYEAIEAAAASVVGTNIMQGNRGETKWYPRIIRWIAVIGSTAAGDAAVDLIIGIGSVAINSSLIVTATPKSKR